MNAKTPPIIHVPHGPWMAHCTVCCEDVNLKSSDPEYVKRHFGHPLIVSPQLALTLFPEPPEMAIGPFSLN